jgi:hypothetical protein
LFTNIPDHSAFFKELALPISLWMFRNREALESVSNDQEIAKCLMDYNNEKFNSSKDLTTIQDDLKKTVPSDFLFPTDLNSVDMKK